MNLPDWKKAEILGSEITNMSMYDQIPLSIKRKYNLSIRDEGIDLAEINDDCITKVGQVKYYKSYVSFHELGTFLGQCIYKLPYVEKLYIGGINTKFPKCIPENEILKLDVKDYKEQPIIQNEKYELRDYQINAIEKIKSCDDDLKICFPCGCGKSDVIYAFNNLNCLILVPSIALAEQFKNHYNNKCNCYWTNTKIYNKNNKTTICVYNSVDEIKNLKFDLIFIDEAHHILNYSGYMDDSSEELSLSSDDSEELYSYDSEELILSQTNNSYIAKIQKMKGRKIYLSATLDNPDVSLSLDEAINRKYLVDYQFELIYIDMNKKIESMERIFNGNKHYEHIIIFSNTIEQAKTIGTYFNSKNLKTEVLISETPKKEREAIIKEYENGNIRILSVVNCLNEGINIRNTDTVVFCDDRSSEINIVQCIGRGMRLCEGKFKCKIILFANCEETAECKYLKYLKALDKYDHTLRENVKDKFIVYNCSNKNINVEELEQKYFNTIIRFRLTDDNKINLCKEFYNEFRRLPKNKETYKGFNIGYFVQGIRRGENSHLKPIIEEIFHCKLDKKISLTDNERINLCKEFHKDFHRLPKDREIYKGFNIGCFIRHIKEGYNSHLKPIVEEIFGVKLEIIKKSKPNIIPDTDKLQYCREHFIQFKRLPRNRETFKGFNIGRLIDGIKQGRQQHLKEPIEQIYGQKIVVNKRLNNEDKIKLFAEYFNEFNKLPSPKAIYKDYKLGSLVNRITRGKNKDLREPFEKICGIILYKEK